MTDAYQEVLEETRIRLVRVEGELASTKSQLAASVTTEVQLLQELDAVQIDAAAAHSELAHAQHELEERNKHVGELEERFFDALRSLREAEGQRAVVIAALGRRSRKALDRVETDGTGAH